MMFTRQMIEDELRGALETRRLLEVDPEAWRDGLVAIVQDVDTQFSRRQAAAQTMKAECLELGAEGRARWVAYAAQYREWRGAANGYKRRVVARLREVKALIKARNVDTQSWSSEVWAEVRAAVDEWEDLGLGAEEAMNRIAASLRQYDDRMEMAR